ncbi:hypothetical protein B0T44_08020 [Nocardia donostiensis]|uniref:Uncharacterized protein n=1 Tax=Nocardia donostiensis TaxID=1538463 RepID=A0A1V2TEV2_9NOCA|nr:hypothetical protein B0T46_15415 [Nocardia donostiensis]OQS13084.1 hypothetical protein B0T36_21205 [Nocardia donostiensis]OQS21546.1 hypothetical protein B0T44_08020 [Nocardia donostiensis]
MTRGTDRCHTGVRQHDPPPGANFANTNLLLTTLGGSLSAGHRSGRNDIAFLLTRREQEK